MQNTLRMLSGLAVLLVLMMCGQAVASAEDAE